MAGIIITADESDWKKRQKNAARAVGNATVNSSSIEATEEDLVVRGILPAEDFDSGEANGWSDTAQWRQDLSTDGTAGQFNEAYDVDSDGRAEDKVIGIYGISLLHSDVETRTLRFTDGRDAVNGTAAEYNIELLESDEEKSGLLTSDVYFGPTDHGQILHWTEEATDDNRLVYHGFVGESVADSPFSQPYTPEFC